MKKLFSLFIFLLLSSCKDNPVVNSDIPTPVLVPRSSDTAVIERGIRAWPEAAINTNGGIRIEWFALRDVGGYSVYRTDKLDSATKKPGDFRKIAHIRIGETTEDTAYVDTLIELGKEYFYTVRAFDRSLKESEGKNSDTASFLMEGKISLVYPVNVISPNDSLQFRWTGSTGTSVIRVYETVSSVNHTIKRPVWVYQGIPRSFSDPYFVYNTDGKAQSLTKGTYRWRITRTFPGEKARGAASGWKSFTIE